MKKEIIFALMAIILLVTGCQKERGESQTPVSQQDVIDHPTSNTSAKESVFDPILENKEKTSIAKARRQASSTVTLFVNYEGEAGVSGAPWGLPGVFNCPTSGLTSAKKDSITAMVVEDYAPFTIRFAKSQQEFNSASYPKMKAIVTRKTSVIMASPQLGPNAGVAYVSSILWGDNTPCFVFTNEFSGVDRFKKIAEAISHEIGHTFGLYHQSESDGSPCGFIGEYRFASNDFSKSALMGNPYQGKASRWIIGPSTSLPCGTLQNDAEVIGSIAGYKGETFGSSFSGAPSLGTSWLSGVLVSASSQHAFRKTSSGTKVLKVVSEGNVDVKVAVYNSPTSTTPVIYDDSNSLGLTVTLSGQKWIKVFTTQPEDFSPSPVGGSYSLRLQ